MSLLASLSAVFFVAGLNLCSGQANAPVRWHFQSDPISGNEAVLTMTASIAPGWHLYSQFMEEGGPTPTRVSFERNDDFALAGKTEENGNPVKFHDDTYEMEITWFAGEVVFRQKIMVIQPTSVHGIIEYLVCNDHLCIPQKRNFSIDLPSLKKSP